MSRFTKWASADRTTGRAVAVLVPAGVVLIGIIPTAILVACPRVDRLLHLDFVEASGISVAVGGVLLALGLAFGLSSVFLQLTRGDGTPVPVVPTRESLVSGPYRYCRNPMTFGTVTAYLGLGLAAATVSGATLALVIGAALTTYLKTVEEKELEERFGEPYLRYKQEVPFIIPKVPRSSRRNLNRGTS